MGACRCGEIIATPRTVLQEISDPKPRGGVDRLRHLEPVDHAEKRSRQPLVARAHRRVPFPATHKNVRDISLVCTLLLALA
jgi:hypothetical protein